jgi:two-component system LytT family response regulator
MPPPGFRPAAAVRYPGDDRNQGIFRHAHGMGTMRFLVVGQDGPGRSALIRHCERAADLKVVGEAEFGAAAIQATRALRPDVLLLNSELPDMSGFDVLRAVRSEPGPLGIIVTPHADHAVTAFAEGAFDYLLDPVSSHRFDQAMERARQRLDSIGVGASAQPRRGPLAPIPAFDASRFSPPKFLVGERRQRLYPLELSKIDYIESDGNYVTIRSGGAEYLSRDSIKRLSVALSDHGFVRIERSLLVNISAVSYVELAGHGSYAFTLACGACLYSGVAYRDGILRVLPLSRRGGPRAG